jgi:hypothetical protein
MNYEGIDIEGRFIRSVVSFIFSRSAAIDLFFFRNGVLPASASIDAHSLFITTM